VTDKEVQLTLDTLMQLIQSKDAQVIIAIDEFQQINYYPRPTLAATLRAYIQTVENLSFIFSGSERNLLLDMFSSPKQALFRTTQLLPLEKIDAGPYAEYIKFNFRQGLKEISDAGIDEILEWSERHTYYTQYLCHRLYEKSGKKVDLKLIKEVEYQIIKENEQVFYNYRKLLSKQQWKLLNAIGREGIVDEPTSKAFINKYNLGSHSTVRLSLSALEDKQLIYSTVNRETDKTEYKVYDVFLVRWIQAR